MKLKIETAPDGIVIHVKAVPNSSRDQIIGVLGDALKIKVTAPPENGKANEAICRLLAHTLGTSPSHVALIAGSSKPLKRISISGMDATTFISKVFPDSR